MTAQTWAGARTLQDLCDLTAAWLRGDIAEQPGYEGPVDIDDEFALLPALLAANRTGFLTRNSQAGHADGSVAAHAAVDGWATRETVYALWAALRGQGFEVLAAEPREPLGEYGVEVTFDGDVPVTWFGGRLPADEVAWQLEGCGAESVRWVVETALSVVVWDPMPGRNTLWAALSEACDTPVSSGV